MSSFAGRDLKLTLLEASDQLGVSSGTLRNWVRSGLLRARKTGLQTFFDRNEINLFQKKIKSGQILKLRKRANKNISEKTHGHAELLLNKENEGLLVQLLNRNSKSPQHILLAIYLVQLIKQGLCRLEKSGLKFKNEQLKKEISEWGLNLNSTDLKSKLYEIQESSLDFSDHLLSYAYQYMSRIGEKQKAGAYYTPTGIIQKLMNSVMKQPGTLLDPCCGSGHFLVEGLQHLRAMGVDQPWSYIYGSDLDLNAVRVARAHLTLASAGQADSLGQIRHQDALLESAWSLKFKYVLTNPPWGAKISQSDLAKLRKKYPMLKSDESFSFFILAALKHLESNGQLGFVLPDSFLNVKTHADIRKELLTNYSIQEITRIFEKFSGVLTKSFTIKVEKKKPLKNHFIKIRNGAEEFDKTNSDILAEAACSLSIESNQASDSLLKVLEQQGRSYLKENADWALGIVTGDNEKFLSFRPRKGFEPVYKGSDILRFGLKDPKRFLLLNQKKLQQVAPIEKYRCPEKLIYRFICKELVFAVDRSGSATLNSANILIPHLPNYSLLAVCGILNSVVAQFYYQKKFNTVKTLKGNLEKFPFPLPNVKLLKSIEKTVTRLESKYSAADYSQLNSLVMDLYGLSRKNRELLNTLKLSPSFIAAR